MSRPHVPEIFVGLRLRFCVLAILMETGWKSSQKFLAAERSSAHAESAHHLRLVSDADLPQLDARAEGRGEILDELPEVDAAFGRKEEEDLAAVERNLGGDELHVQLVVPRFFAGRPRKARFSFS